MWIVEQFLFKEVVFVKLFCSITIEEVSGKGVVARWVDGHGSKLCILLLQVPLALNLTKMSLQMSSPTSLCKALRGVFVVGAGPVCLVTPIRLARAAWNGFERLALLGGS